MYSEWHDVKDGKRPTKAGDYLLILESGDISTGYFSDFFQDGDFEPDKVGCGGAVYWQDLPQPPKEQIKITIPLPPVTKKNHGRIIMVNGKPRMIPSKAFCNYQKAAKPYLEPLGVDYKCNVKCLFYMQTRRIVDLVGLLQAIDDVLAHYGVITEDNSRIIAGHDGSRVLYDKENPRTEIVIERWDDGESS